MKKNLLLTLILSFTVIAHEEEGSGTTPSANAAATEYIILLCATPNGSVIDAKQSNNVAAYQPECSAKAAQQNTEGQVIESNL